MKYFKFCTSITVFYLLLNFFQKADEIHHSNNIERSIYSGYYGSQNKLSTSEKLDLSCKFKSMNRKLKKKNKLKNSIITNKT